MNIKSVLKYLPVTSAYVYGQKVDKYSKRLGTRERLLNVGKVLAHCLYGVLFIAWLSGMLYTGKISLNEQRRFYAEKGKREAVMQQQREYRERMNQWIGRNKKLRPALEHYFPDVDFKETDQNDPLITLYEKGFLPRNYRAALDSVPYPGLRRDNISLSAKVQMVRNDSAFVDNSNPEYALKALAAGYVRLRSCFDTLTVWRMEEICNDLASRKLYENQGN